MASSSRTRVLKDNPGIAGELTRAFEAAKAEYLKDLQGNEISIVGQGRDRQRQGGR